MPAPSSAMPNRRAPPPRRGRRPRPPGSPCASARKSPATPPRRRSTRTPRGGIRGAGLGRRLARRHGRGKVDEPPRVGGEAAHHLQGGGRVPLADHDVRHSRVSIARRQVVGVEHSSSACGGGHAGAALGGNNGGPDAVLARPGPRPAPARVAQGGQPPPNTHPVSMQIVRFSHSGRGSACGRRRPSPAPVVRGPVVAHRQAELVGLAGRLAVQGERPHPPDTRPWSFS